MTKPWTWFLGGYLWHGKKGFPTSRWSNGTIKKIAEIVEEVVQVANGLHEEFNEGGHNNEGDVPPMFEGDHEPLGERSFEFESQEASFDLVALENAI